MISSQPIFPPASAYATGALNPQPDGTVTITANDDNLNVFSVVTPSGALVQKPKGTAGPNEKFVVNPGGATVSAFIDNIEYCYSYDGRVQ